MIENFGDKRNTNGLDKNPNNINKKGRTPSLKRQLEKIALSDGWLTVDIKDVIIDDDVVKIKIPKEEAMALRIFKIAMGKNPSAAMSAIKLYLETFDGKANQNISVRTEYDDLTEEQIEERLMLLKEMPEIDNASK